MVLKSNTNVNHLSSCGDLFITIDLISQAPSQNTSDVRVTGVIQNTGPNTVENNTNDVSSSIKGDNFFQGNDFNFRLSPNEKREFIQHTFTRNHGADGNLTVDYIVHFGETGTFCFGGDREVDATLFCPHIDQNPDKPGQPSVTNLLPGSCTVSWTAPDDPDDHASDILTYVLRVYKGPTATGTHVDYDGLERTRNLVDLIPGQQYTFTVIAINASKIQNGLSDPSTARTITMPTGVKVRSGGTWKTAVAWVRDEGVWKPAVPYVRQSGTWKTTT